MPHHILLARYDVQLVFLSYLIAVFASYTALDFAGHVTTAQGRARYGWLGGGALALGLGIWSMHFTGMLAFSLPLVVSYDVPLVLLSLLVALGAAAFTLVVVSRPHVTTRHLLVAGPLLGAGIASMHYLGMASIRVAATMHYQPLVVALSLVIAVVAATAALWLSVQFRTGRSRRWSLKLGSAVIMGFAITAMHYTGMIAAAFTAAPNAVAGTSTETVPLALAIGFGTFLTLGLALVSALVSRRFSAQTAEFESLFVHNPAAVFTCTVDGSIRGANAAAAQLSGRSIADLVGQRFVSLLDPTTNTRARERLAQAAEGDSQQWQTSLVQLSGEWRTVNLTTLPIVVNMQRLGVYVVAQDISERVAAETAVRASEERYRAMLRDLATPLVPLSDTIVALPLVGVLDSERARQMERTLLHHIASSRCQVVIIDLTGVPAMDTDVADALIRAAQAVRLLGAEVMLTGLRAEFALTFIQLGINLKDIPTYRQLHDGIQHAMRRDRGAWQTLIRE